VIKEHERLKIMTLERVRLAHETGDLKELGFEKAGQKSMKQSLKGVSPRS